VHLYSIWSSVWSSLLQGHVALSVILNLWRYALVFPCPVTIAVKFVFTFKLRLILSRTVGRNCLVTAAFLHCSHSSCHFCVASSSNSLCRVLFGILSKTTGTSVVHAAYLAKRSASSLPWIPTWALTHENPIVQLVLSRLSTLFLISSMRWLWLLAFLNESMVILLSVNMHIVRGVFSAMSISCITYIHTNIHI